IFRSANGDPLIKILRTTPPPTKDVRIARQNEIDDLKRMDFFLTYIAPEREENWSNWYVLSGVKHGTVFYFRRWLADDSVVSIEFVYPKEQAVIFNKVIPRMTRDLTFSASMPKGGFQPPPVPLRDGPISNPRPHGASHHEGNGSRWPGASRRKWRSWTWCFEARRRSVPAPPLLLGRLACRVAGIARGLLFGEQLGLLCLFLRLELRHDGGLLGGGAGFFLGPLAAGLGFRERL